MSDALILPVPRASGPDDVPVADRLHRGVAEVAGRLGRLLGPDHEAAAFLAAMGQRAPAGPRSSQPPHPVDRLAAGLGLSPALVDVVLLAGAAEEHEGLA